MSKYNSDVFLGRLNKKIGGTTFSPCPFCGSRDFSSVDKLASVLIGDDVDSLNLGPSIPCGMVICQKCGHVNMFALGILGMLDKENDVAEEKE